MAGYHLTEIKRGKLGQLSKVQEEFEEAVDSLNQGVKIMLLVEFSDLVGAVKAVAQTHRSSLEQVLSMRAEPKRHQRGSLNKIGKKIQEARDAELSGVNIRILNSLAEILEEVALVARTHGATMDDLLKMQVVTERAFTSGSRKSNE